MSDAPLRHTYRKDDNFPKPPRSKTYAQVKDRGCTRKVDYQSLFEAERAATHANERAKHTHIKPYKCEFCPAWHIGHPKGAKNERGYTPPSVRTVCWYCGAKIWKARMKAHFEAYHETIPSDKGVEV